MGKRQRRKDARAQKPAKPKVPRSLPGPRPVEEPQEAPVPAQEPPAPAELAPRRSVRTACYVDFENLFFNCAHEERAFSVGRAVRSLNRLSREACGEGFAHTAVYANWDAVSALSRYAQNDWAQVGWRTVAVPTREDRVSGRTVKNLVDFVMSLDLLEDARDRDFDHFFIVSGDADFCEVVERLKRLRRRVTVVCLRKSLSYRLSEAADETVVWDYEDISGKDTYPLKPFRRAPRTARVPPARPDEDEFTVLKRAVGQAEADEGGPPVPWATIRDEYYLPMTGGGREEADLFVRQLAQAGYVILSDRRGRDGVVQCLQLPA